MRSIDLMLSRDGVYVIVTDSSVGLVEVEKGHCWQLSGQSGNPRDGELAHGRWDIHRIQWIYGPFQRTLTPAPMPHSELIVSALEIYTEYAREYLMGVEQACNQIWHGLESGNDIWNS